MDDSARLSGMTDGDLARLARAFCDCTLPKDQWTHGAHFATALWLILTRPDVVAEHDMPGMIRRYNESVGGVNDDRSGYHETITLASLHMTRRLLAGLVAGLDEDVTPAGAFAALMASPLGNKDWPLAHWTRDRLFSTQARRSWVDPDIAPLPA